MLITPEYRELNRRLHQENEHYGTSGKNWREAVRELSEYGRLRVLDYGCGRCTLSKALGPAYRVTNYDPCIEGLDTPPEPHDVVVCGDVMEHVEPDLVMNVLREVRRLCKVRGLFVIGMQPAKKTLADGRNAHLSLHTQEQWVALLTAAGFTVDEQSNPAEKGHNSWFVVV
jgi:2-polyprenyl-3-methyl-5-hydroxy-6-metoxy-1,4-benzoquinol methylase